jgi:hypothetical protein
MVDGFVGSAEPLTAGGFGASVSKLGLDPATVWAVIFVETSGKGFLPDKRPELLFERHIFHQKTNGKFDAQDSDISNASPGGYGLGGAHQYDRLTRALAFERSAALQSASWGIGQIMGFNAVEAGYADVEAMVAAMTRSEDEQLRGMLQFIAHSQLHFALQRHDWTQFARAYNGPDFARNSYDKLLAQNFVTYSVGPLPDLDVRAVQLYLTYCGYAVGPVDGILGRLTRSAIGEFRLKENLPGDDDISNELIAKVKARAGQ